MIDSQFKYKSLIDQIRSISPFVPELALILGSGLGNFAETISIEKTISTADLPDFPKSTIKGHVGKIHFGKFHNKNLLLFQGRIHLYEGYSIYQCVLPVYIAHRLNCKKIILTNAAGGINTNLKPSDLMLITSFNAIALKKELTKLIGLADESGSNNFRRILSRDLNEIIRTAAKQAKVNLKDGIYWYTKGPSYETPAEVKFISKFGGDAVGMSTVHEAVYASYLGIETAAISCITNFAAGLTENKLSHDEVTESANLAQLNFERLIKKIIKII